MLEALKESKRSIDSGDGPFGAVIVNPEGEIVSRAGCSVISDNDPTSHAEVNAIRKLCSSEGIRNFRGYYLYSTTEPCALCMFTCLKSGIDNIYYGAEHQRNASLIVRADYMVNRFKKFNVNLVGGILEQRCLDQRNKAGVT